MEQIKPSNNFEKNAYYEEIQNLFEDEGGIQLKDYLKFNKNESLVEVQDKLNTTLKIYKEILERTYDPKNIWQYDETILHMEDITSWIMSWSELFKFGHDKQAELISPFFETLIEAKKRSLEITEKWYRIRGTEQANPDILN